MLKVHRVTFDLDNMPLGPNHDPVSYLNDGQTVDGYKYAMDFDETHTWLKVVGTPLDPKLKTHTQWIPFMRLKSADFIEVKQTEASAPKKAKSDK